MGKYVLRVIAVLVALIFSLGLAAPSQAATWNIKETPSGSPGCTKGAFGFMNCDRAKSWGFAADAGLYAAKQKTGINRSIAMKNAVTLVIAPIANKAQADEINRTISNSINVNQALCMKEELQRTTNRITAKSKLIKEYYSYLKVTYPILKKAPFGNIYQTALKNSKKVSNGILSSTERNQLKVGLTSCHRR